ncbi:MAG TPA: DUF389 domain-containing protein [Acidimicrobiia bacterium]
MLSIKDSDLARMRDQVFFEGAEAGRKLSRFWMLLILAAIIAAAGVVADSVATVIGAMIVAPLMVPILGTLLGVVLADRANLMRCFGLVVAGALAVAVIGYLVGVLGSTPVLAETNSQVAGRVNPRLVDLLAALATGAVGSIALARDDISDTLPGVAIAVSLVPPLAVVGLTLESGAPGQAAGALLLFVTNVSAILAAGLAVMFAYQVHRRAAILPHGKVPGLRRGRAIAVIVASVALIAVPLGMTSASIAAATAVERTVQDAADDWIDGSEWDLLGVTHSSTETTVRVTGPEPSPDPADLRSLLDEAGLDELTVVLELIPSQHEELS